MLRGWRECGFVRRWGRTHHRIAVKKDSSSACYDGVESLLEIRIRFMTAITPAYAAYQATCLTTHMPTVPRQNFCLPKLKARYPYLPNARSTTRERGNDYPGWALYTDGGTRAAEGETLAGWSVISRSLHVRIDIMFVAVVTTEAHLAFSGAPTTLLK